MSRIEVDELVAWMDESGANMSAAAAHFGTSKMTIRNLLHSPGDHLGDHPPSKLTEWDATVLEALKRFVVENGWAPTVRELAELVGRSVNPTHNTLHKLAAHGLIEMSGQPRALRVVGSTVDMSGAHHVPLAG